MANSLSRPWKSTENVNLGSDPSVLDLARRLTETGVLEILELRNGLTVRSSSFVGRFRLGEIDITVVPKLPSDALLKLLRVHLWLRDLRLLPSTTHSTQNLVCRTFLSGN